ncbi:hypothetical protein BC829DRAFT_24391 [Chytridium lagenaria]|nr:hypothetical protein BC829DRAFT_24391 [Chytridium lagenaria]
MSASWDALLQPSFYVSLPVGLIINTLVYFVCVRFFPKKFDTEQKKAWILTFLSSSIMTAACIPFVVDYAMNSGNISTILLLNSPLAVIFSTFFISYLWADCFIGFICYRSSFNLVTGWIHHILYTFLVGFAIVFLLPGAFMIAALLELPTIFLSVGHIWKFLRSDLLFGLTFFLTRICFHGYLTYTLHTSWPNLFYWIFGVIVYPLHLYWFTNFIRQQIRMRRDEQKTAPESPQQADLEANVEPVITMTSITTVAVKESPTSTEMAEAFSTPSIQTSA